MSYGGAAYPDNSTGGVAAAAVVVESAGVVRIVSVGAVPSLDEATPTILATPAPPPAPPVDDGAGCAAVAVAAVAVGVVEEEEEVATVAVAVAVATPSPSTATVLAPVSALLTLPSPFVHNRIKHRHVTAAVWPRSSAVGGGGGRAMTVIVKLLCLHHVGLRETGAKLRPVVNNLA